MTKPSSQGLKTLLSFLEQGEVDDAYKTWNQYRVDPFAHPFLLNIFLSQSREKGRKRFVSGSERGASIFYDFRMKIAVDMMKQGFVLHAFDEARDKQHEESHEVELLCREPLYAGMGDVHPIPLGEGQDRVKCLEYYLKQTTPKLPLNQEMFGRMAYVEPEEFTLALVKAGMFDQAMKDNFPKDTIFSSKRADVFFATPNKVARSAIIERALDRGIASFEDMNTHGFTLFDVADVGKHPSLTLKMMEAGFLLPRIDDKCLDGGAEQSFYLWGEEQIKAWTDYDPEGMLLPIQFAPIKRNNNPQPLAPLVMNTLEEFTLNPRYSFLHLGLWEGDTLVRKGSYTKFDAEDHDKIRSLFALAQARVLHKHIASSMEQNHAPLMPPKKM